MTILVTYDIESYPNFFCLCAKSYTSGKKYQFEISERVNDINQLIDFMRILANQNAYLVGFNNVGYDYPVLHHVLSGGNHFEKTQEIIGSDFGYRGHLISKPLIKQVDLMLINHYNNMAKATSLKQLEFVMRSDNLQDLPYEPGTCLSHQAMEDSVVYCHKDVEETEKFLKYSMSAVEFRIQLGNDYLLNADDTKIGEHTLVEKIGRHKCYGQGRQPIQTFRDQINLAECIVPYVKFKDIELRKAECFLKAQVIKETKGVFDGLKANLKGFDLVFGLGGLHGCIEPSVVRSCDKYLLIDMDVTSYYPSLAISNNFYPEHLGIEFVGQYANLKTERQKYAKGTPENAMFKLALNGAYGKSNSKYSPLYDPKFTMQITINGQLLLCMLLEELMSINLVSPIQANTDGVTMLVRRTKIDQFMQVCKDWEKLTGLELERADYSAMYIRDVNNYIAVGEKGIKYKGCYDHDREYHKNHSQMVVPKVAELHMMYGAPIEETVRSWTNPFDFMLFAKSSGTLDIDGKIIQRRSRYYISTSGGTLTKTLKSGRASKLQKEFKVTECNSNTNLVNIDYDYYIEEVKKICVK